MNMRGLALRICLIMAAALGLVLLTVFLAFIAQRQSNDASGFRLPLPDQIAALVELVESAPPEDLPLVLRALNGPSLKISLEETPPPVDESVSLPGLAWIVQRYLSALGGRPVQAVVDLDENESSADAFIRLGPDGLWAPHPVRLVITLRDGRILVAEAHNPFLQRFNGLRIAIGVLLATAFIAMLSLWALRRQIRPLEKLADAVERFGARLDEPVMKEEGAKEVRQLIGAIARMQARIRDLVAGRTRMIAAIGHDLGTYLTRLRLRAEMIPDSDQRERAIRDIEDMSALVSDTLTLARLEHDAEPRRKVDLVALLRRHVEGFTASDEKVELRVPPEPVEIPVRKAAFGRAINNLISNALKYGGEALVTLSRSDGVVEIRVEDRGPGIPPEEREHVLEPFYRRDTARNLDQGGFGLGLAIVADIVRRHDGAIALDDRPDGGLSVVLRLPI